MANTYTNFGGIVLLSPTFKDISNDVVEFDWSPETDIPSVKVYGPLKTRAAQGSTTWKGHIKVVYDYAGGANVGYRVLQAEADTPTAGGLYCQYKPTGEGSGEEMESGYIIVAQPKMDDRGADAIQTRTFEFTVNGTVTKAAQTT